jgi:hypothetical protein
MVIPNNSVAEACFQMLNKQPDGYLYHELPTFGATPLFVKTILRWWMEAGLATEAPLCTYDSETKVLMAPQDATQDGILSNVCSLSIFQDVLANKQTADASTKGKKKGHTTPKMCFQLGSAQSVQTVHGANDGIYTNVTKPGIDLRMATQASVAKPSNQPVIEIASSEDEASSSEGSEEGSNYMSSSDNLSALSSSKEEEQSMTPAGRR